MTFPVPSKPAGPAGPSGILTTQQVADVKGPNSTTIEIVADILGSRGTQVNVRAAFTTNGSLPAISPSAVASGYVIGDSTVIRFEVYPPKFLGAIVRPYVIRCLVEAVNAVDPADKVAVRFDVTVPISTDTILGMKPEIAVDGVTSVPALTTGPTTTIDGAKTVVTTRYVTAIIIQDPQVIQILGLVLGPANSIGTARLHLPAPAFSPPDPNYPTLPAYGAPFSGDLIVGEEAPLLGLARTHVYRGANANRKVFIRTRAEDLDDATRIYVMEMELDLQSHKTLLALDVLVHFNNALFPIEDLPQVSGIYQLTALDYDTVEIVVRASGDAGTQVVVRSVREVDPAPAPSFVAIGSIVTYDTATGVQKYGSNPDYLSGVFGIDDRVQVVGDIDLVTKQAIAIRANTFRALAPGAALNFRVDATSTVNVSNTIQRTFSIRAIAPLIVTDVQFFYNNSRNPDAYLPVQAGTDVNGTIIGAGTLVSPFFIPVDKPEEIQFFAVVSVNPNQLALVQTGFAYEPTILNELYPAQPHDWSRAFKNGDRVGIHPHPVPPGEQHNRPLTGEQFIIASGSKMVSAGGDSKSKSTKLRALATGVGNAANVIDLSIWVRVHDPAVVVP